MFRPHLSEQMAGTASEGGITGPVSGVTISWGGQVPGYDDDVFDGEANGWVSEAGQPERTRPREAISPSLGDACVISDKHGIILDVNASTATLFGYRMSELVGQHVEMLMTPSDAAEHGNHMRRWRETGQASVMGMPRPILALRSDGSQIPVEISLNVNGDGSQLVATFRDLSRHMNHLAAGIPQRYTSEFEELAKLGEGGFGEVFKCRHRVDGHVYAIKKIRLPGSGRKATRPGSNANASRHLREAQILATVGYHPNLVRYHSSWVQEEPKVSSRFRRTTSGRRVGVEDFRAIRNVSAGSYGRVYLVESRVDHQLFAMKVIPRSAVQRDTARRRLLAERDLMIRAKAAPHAVDLYAAFRTEANVYFLMEWCPGGDLATMIENTGGIQEAVVRRYTAELVVIIGSLHRLGIVHRDIKPDNVLIDATGHLKLTDFGLSSLGHDGRPDGSAEPTPGASSTSLIVGTPKYLAPESVMNQAPSYDVDWWALGVTIFISLTARAPFRHRTENGMFRRILAGQYVWPSSMPVAVSPECKDVVAAFLTVDRRLRLGARGEPEVRAHPWFTGIDFDTLHDAPPPSVPSLDNSLDTGNFPTLPGEKNVAPSGLVEDDARTPPKDHSFDFSFFDVPVDIPEEEEEDDDDDEAAEAEVERDPQVEEELRRIAKKSQEGEWLSANLRVPPKRGDGLSPLEFGMSGFPGHGFDESTDEEFASFSMSSNPSSGMRSPMGQSLLSRSSTPKLSTSAPSQAGSWRRRGTKMVSVLYIQMEYVPSLTLRGYLDERPQLDAVGPTGGPHPMVTDAVAILGQITKGLAFLHSRYVIHRDLKPQNIFVRREADGTHTALIGDFGLAVSSEASGGPPGSFMMSTSDDESSEQSVRGGVTTDDILGVGTLLYASPEQLQRSSRHLMVLSSSTDIFSLGIITVELFCNSIYHTAPLRHRRRLNNARVGQLPTEEPVLSARPELRALIRGMVSPVPEDRPRADEVLRHPVLGTIRRSSSSMLSGDDDESSGSESHRVRRRPLRRRKSSRTSLTSGGRAAAAAARTALRASTGGMTLSCGKNEEGGCVGCAHCTGQSPGIDRATSESRRSRHERTMSKSASPTGKSSGLAQMTAFP